MIVIVRVVVFMRVFELLKRVLLNAISLEVEALKQSQQQEKEEEQAVVKLQAAQRGKQDRAKVNRASRPSSPLRAMSRKSSRISCLCTARRSSFPIQCM